MWLQFDCWVNSSSPQKRKNALLKGPSIMAIAFVVKSAMQKNSDVKFENMNLKLTLPPLGCWEVSLFPHGVDPASLASQLILSPIPRGRDRQLCYAFYSFGKGNSPRKRSLHMPNMMSSAYISVISYQVSYQELLFPVALTKQSHRIWFSSYVGL